MRRNKFETLRPNNIFIPFAIIVALGTYFFTYGFFFIKNPLENTSTFNPVTNSTKWFEPQVSKVIVLTIDALQFEFLLHSSHENQTQYANNFAFLNNLMKDEPDNTLLLKLYSDPPTVTQQRIKSILVGNLPPFIDIAKNFGTYRITEDNMVHQMMKNNLTVFQTGDFIWEYLLGQSFTESRPYDSFDITDFDTVDRHAITDVFEFLQKDDWNIIFAHLVGIDHIGHMYQMDHPDMRKKMKEIDRFFEKLFKTIDNETLIIIHGDHGMTFEGDHGGSSAYETSTGSFAYIGSGFHPLTRKYLDLRDSYPHATEKISLINLAPTVSWLLGIPIPYSSIGRIIPDFFTNKALGNISDVDFLYRLTQDYFINVNQVDQYITESHLNHSKYREADCLEFQMDLQSLTLQYAELHSRYTEHQTKGRPMTEKEEQEFIRDAREVIQKMRGYIHNVYQKTRQMMSFDNAMLMVGIVAIILSIVIAVLIMLYLGAISKLSEFTEAPPSVSVSQFFKNVAAPLLRIEVFLVVIIVLGFLVSEKLHPLHFLAIGTIIMALIVIYVLFRELRAARSFIREAKHERTFYLRNSSFVQLELYYNPLLHRFQFTVASCFLIGYHAAVMFSLAMLRRECTETVKVILSSVTLLFTFCRLQGSGFKASYSTTAILCVAVILSDHVSDMSFRDIQDFFLNKVKTTNIIHDILWYHPVKIILPLILHPIVLLSQAKSNGYLKKMPYVALYAVGYALIAGYYTLKCYYGMENEYFVRYTIPRITYLTTAALFIYCFVLRNAHLSRVGNLRLILEIMQLPLFLIMGENNLLTLLLIRMAFNSSLKFVKELDAEDRPYIYCLLATLGSVFFFATGHGNQTSTLQVQKGFLGFEKFNIYISGTLVLINTFISYIYGTIYFMIAFERKPPMEACSVKHKREDRQYKKIQAIMFYFICPLVSLLLVMLNCYVNRESLILVYDFAPKYMFEVSTVTFLYSMLFVFYLFY